jgi:hypothetical protein
MMMNGEMMNGEKTVVVLQKKEEINTRAVKLPLLFIYRGCRLVE